MAQPPPEDEEQFLTSIFPAPPPFYKHFTPAAISALQDAQERLTSNSDPETISSSPSKKKKDVSPFPTTLTRTHLLDLPAPLREQLTYLIPPSPPPPSAEYRVFGKPTKLGGDDPFEYIMQYVRNRLWNPETKQGLLPLWEYKKLYPDPTTTAPEPADPYDAPTHKPNQVQEEEEEDQWSTLNRQTYLFRFLRSIMLKHIELLGILATDPTAPAPPPSTPDGAEAEPAIILPENPFDPGKPLYDKAKDKVLREILNLVMNMHALINEYRPHQARETLIRVMEAQVERKRAEIEGVRRMRERVAEALEGLQGVRGGDGGGGEGAAEEGAAEEGAGERDEVREGMRVMWRALEGV